MIADIVCDIQYILIMMSILHVIVLNSKAQHSIADVEVEQNAHDLDSLRRSDAPASGIQQPWLAWLGVFEYGLKALVSMGFCWFVEPSCWSFKDF